MTRTKNVRNTTKFKRSIKAISPVIATLLMIAIAVVASLVAYAWVMGYMGFTTSNAGKAIDIPSVASVGGHLYVYVQNVGQSDLALKQQESLYVNSNLVPITLPVDPITITKGQTIELQTAFDYVSGDKVNIKVTTTDGTFMTKTGTGTSSTGSPNPTTGSITVWENAVPNDATAFVFTTTGTGFSGFSIIDNSGTAGTAAATVSGLAPGTYTITQTARTGWPVSTITGATSSDVNARSASVTVVAGGSYTVTFTNTQATTGSITVWENAVPNDATAFVFTTTGTGFSGFSIIDNSGTAGTAAATVSGLAPGTYTITQTARTGWPVSTITGATSSDVNARSASVTVVAGGSYTVTFTNTQATTGSITVWENAVPNDATAFVFTTTGTGFSGFSIIDNSGTAGTAAATVSGLAPGTYTITQTARTGWPVSTITGATSSDVNARSASVTVVAGGSYTVTFTNTQATTGSITVWENAVPNDATAFVFTTTGTGFSGFSIIDNSGTAGTAAATVSGLAPGTYTITQTARTGWPVSTITGATSSDVNARSASVTVVAGGSYTVTFTNTQATTGSITVWENAVPNDATAFVFTTTGTGFSGFSIIDNSGTAGTAAATVSGLAPGTYTITQTARTGWTLYGITGATSTNMGTRTATVTVVAGNTYTVTFTNTQDSSRASIFSDNFGTTSGSIDVNKWSTITNVVKTNNNPHTGGSYYASFDNNAILSSASIDATNYQSLTVSYWRNTESNGPTLTVQIKIGAGSWTTIETVDPNTPWGQVTLPLGDTANGQTIQLSFTTNNDNRARVDDIVVSGTLK